MRARRGGPWRRDMASVWTSGTGRPTARRLPSACLRPGEDAMDRFRATRMWGMVSGVMVGNPRAAGRLRAAVPAATGARVDGGVTRGAPVDKHLDGPRVRYLYKTHSGLGPLRPCAGCPRNGTGRRQARTRRKCSSIAATCSGTRSSSTSAHAARPIWWHGICTNVARRPSRALRATGLAFRPAARPGRGREQAGGGPSGADDGETHLHEP